MVIANKIKLKLKSVTRSITRLLEETMVHKNIKINKN